MASPPPPPLCASSGLRGAQGALKGRQTGGWCPNPVSDKLGVSSNLARQGEKTTTKAQRLERTRHVPKLQGLRGWSGENQK